MFPHKWHKISVMTFNFFKQRKILKTIPKVLVLVLKLLFFRDRCVIYKMESPPRYEFIEATKRVTRPDMIQVWEESDAYQEYVGFIMAIGEAIKGKKIRDQVPMSEVCQRLVSLIDNLKSWVEEIPPVEMSSR